MKISKFQGIKEAKQYNYLCRLKGGRGDSAGLGTGLFSPWPVTDGLGLNSATCGPFNLSGLPGMADWLLSSSSSSKK